MSVLVQIHVSVTFIISCVYCSQGVTIAFITGSQRKPGDNVYPRPGQTIAGAFTYAVDVINNQFPLIGNRTLRYVIAETFGDETESIRKTAELWAKDQVFAYIGPQETCVHEARMAASFNLPMISYFCAHAETSDKQLFPTFARTRPPDTQISKSVASLLLTFNWKRVALIYSMTPTATRDFETVAKTIQNTLEANDIKVGFVDRWTSAYYHGYTENPFTQIVENSFQRTRIYIIVGDYFEHLGLLLSLHQKELLLSGEYFVVGVDLEHYDPSQPYKYFRGPLKGDEPFHDSHIHKSEVDTESLFRFYLGVVSSPPTGFDHFSTQVNGYLQLPPFQFENPLSEFGGKRRIPPEAAYLFDAVILYAKAINASLKNNENPFDGKTVVRHIMKTSYFSAMGYMGWIDENGDAEGNYTVLSLQSIPDDGMTTEDNIPESEEVHPSRAMLPVGFFEYVRNESFAKFKLTGIIDWVGNRPPFDEPPCGFDGSRCHYPPDNRREIMAVFLSILLVSSCLVAAVFYRNWKYEQEIAGLLWRISMKDLHFVGKKGTGSAFYLNPLSGSRSPSLSQTSAASNEIFCGGQVFTQIANYRGSIVAVKRLKFPHLKRLDISRALKKEMKLMKDIYHDNINPFIGAYIEPNEVILVSEYCSKGSLHDILENGDLKLDSIFIASLVFDLINGMIYLTESDLKFHGNLKSHNCLITSRFVLQVSDFGLHSLRSMCHKEPENIDSSRRMLWTAPELLRTPEMLPTFRSDVYSFAIILHEILARNGPFGIDVCASDLIDFDEVNESTEKLTLTGTSEERRRLNDTMTNKKDYGMRKLTARDVILLVRDDSRNPPFRPEIRGIDCQDYVLSTMIDCWSENPDRRSDFRTIRTRLKGMRQGLKSNIIDNMMVMMEKYANNLEELVEDRTMQLVAEKKKTEHLLHQMLPKSVAMDLIQGKRVIPEAFEAVTIFFSDIEGFTAMCAESTPMQVVDFLHDLYQLFDDIISNYDVYKVETIGDAYMVVSGLPIRNGDKHATEIASMAIELLDHVKSFKIRHRPEDRLALRIGIHTGSVVAGVVGKTMPRYCLFGDTVNTASRYESNGEALKIHISPQLREYLIRSENEYIIEECGLVKMKGKGEVMTYWLIGHKNPQEQMNRSSNKPLLYVGDRGVSPCSAITDSAIIAITPTTLSRQGSMVTFKGMTEHLHQQRHHHSHNQLPQPLKSPLIGNLNPKTVKKILKSSGIGSLTVSATGGGNGVGQTCFRLS